MSIFQNNAKEDLEHRKATFDKCNKDYVKLMEEMKAVKFDSKDAAFLSVLGSIAANSVSIGRELQAQTELLIKIYENGLNT